MTEKQFVHLHAHTDLSNSSMFESIASVDDYIEKALEWNMPAICITNHGNVASWLTTKQKTNKAGLKYIHAVEAMSPMTTMKQRRRLGIIITWS